MGYYTQYSISVLPADVDVDEVLEKVKAATGLCLGEVADGTCKWYEHVADMEAASAAVPYVFVLDGYGEEAGDVWRKVFANGLLIWEWKFNTPPEVPDEILTAALAVSQSQREAMERAETETRLARVREELARLEALSAKLRANVP